MKDSFYKIANHIFRLSFPEEISLPVMENYIPFRTTNNDDEITPLLFHLQITERIDENTEGILLKHFKDDTADITVLRLPNKGYLFIISPPNGASCCIVETNAAFSKAKAQLTGNYDMWFFGLNNALMMLYAFASAQHNTILMHASVIKMNGNGFLFLGKSGTGKSTHSRLWLENIPGSELLNDDNPVVRIRNDNQVMVYGSPWSGKTPCYRNEVAPVKGIIRLQQAPENKIERLSHLQAYASILPACSYMKWEENIMEGIHRTVEKLAISTACWQLACLPDKAAAETCYRTVK